MSTLFESFRQMGEGLTLSIIITFLQDLQE